jgi:hypothetical protein
MGDTKRIPCTEHVWNRAKTIKTEEDVTWDKLIRLLLDAYQEQSDAGAEDIAHQITAELDLDATEAKAEIESLADIVEDTKASVEGLEERLSVTLDASERKQLARDIAEELR